MANGWHYRCRYFFVISGYLITSLFVFVGAFDKLGKNTVSDKKTSFKTEVYDNYLVRPISVDDVNFFGKTTPKQLNKNQFYTEIKRLLRDYCIKILKYIHKMVKMQKK